jgi:hypothetical protein
MSHKCGNFEKAVLRLCEALEIQEEKGTCRRTGKIRKTSVGNPHAAASAAYAAQGGKDGPKTWQQIQREYAKV